MTSLRFLKIVSERILMIVPSQCDVLQLPSYFLQGCRSGWIRIFDLAQFLGRMPIHTALISHTTNTYIMHQHSA